MDNDVFSQVASSALDFIEFGISNVDNNPKQSLIAFYTAVELFLKARLLKEHWSLVVAKPESANLEKFTNGLFQSVGLEQACIRLKDIANDAIPKKSFTVFDELRIHRNKIVHFTHEAFLNNPIALQAEQLRTWVHLHILLTEKWEKQFVENADRIAAIQAKMLEREQFLTERFNLIESDILERESLGDNVVYCEFCEKRAGIVLNRGHNGIHYSCLVCETDRTSYEATDAKFDCTQCNNSVEFFHKSITECSNCDHSFNVCVLTTACGEQYGKGDPHYFDCENRVNVFCDLCNHDKPTVFYIDGMWSCVACYLRGYAAVECVNCNVFYFGDTNQLQYVGCHLCVEQQHMHTSIDEDMYNNITDAERSSFISESTELKLKIERRQNL